MGGSGGRTFTSSRGPEHLAKLVRDAEDRTAIAAFETGLAGILNDLLRNANNRDAELVRERLGMIVDALENKIQGSIDQLFGGSVAKHTYVDGLSDVDALLVLDDTHLSTSGPHEALLFLAQTLPRAFGRDVLVTTGRMAVTVEFSDGMQVQLLPALRTAEGLKVPSSHRPNAWSHIHPENFREALVKRNDECGGKLVPTIKLAKAALGLLPEAQRPSGYHVESLAIEAFRNYKGAHTTGAMLPHFFERAKDIVTAPIRDSTGQSVHVDEYLGGASSNARLALSHVLGRIAKRMRNASVARSTAQWKAIFGIEE